MRLEPLSSRQVVVICLESGPRLDGPGAHRTAVKGMVAYIARNERGSLDGASYRPEQGRAVFCCRVDCMTAAEMLTVVTSRTTEGFWKRAPYDPTGQISDGD